MPELELAEWLKGDDIVGDVELEFTDVGKGTEIPQGEGKDPKKAFEIGIIFPNKAKRVWTMNLTSQRAVAKTYGTNTDNWVGKKVVVFTSEENVRGTMRKTIYARTPGEPAKK